MIQCEGCEVWQHSRCVGILDKEVPTSYFCELCHPRNFRCLCGEVIFISLFGKYNSNQNSPKGKMIECSECKTWQHIKCLGKAPRSLPKPHKCPFCDPEFFSNKSGIMPTTSSKKPRLKPGRKKKVCQIILICGKNIS